MIHVFGSDEEKKEEETAQTILSQMNTYLHQKYGTMNYEILSFIKKGWDIGYDELDAKTTLDGKEVEFKVTREKTGEGYIYRDSFFEHLIKQQADGSVEAVAKEVLKDDGFKILLSCYGPYMGYSKEMTREKTFTDAINEGEYKNTFAVIKAAVVFRDEDSKEDSERKVRKLAEKWFKKEGVHCGFSFYFVKEKIFKEITPSKLFRGLSDDKLEEFVLYISK